MTCLLDTTDSFLKQLASIATCRYLKELPCTKHNTNESIDYLNKPSQHLKSTKQILYANEPIFCYHVTVYCSLGMLMFTLYIFQLHNYYELLSFKSNHN